MFWYLVVTKIVLIADLMSEPNLFSVDGPRREVLLSHVGLAQWQFMSRNYDKLLNFVSIVNCFLSFRIFFCRMKQVMSHLCVNELKICYQRTTQWHLQVLQVFC